MILVTTTLGRAEGEGVNQDGDVEGLGKVDGGTIVGCSVGCEETPASESGLFTTHSLLNEHACSGVSSRPEGGLVDSSERG